MNRLLELEELLKKAKVNLEKNKTMGCMSDATEKLDDGKKDKEDKEDKDDKSKGKVSFSKNGQWSLNKASDRVQRSVPNVRTDVKEIKANSVKVITPKDQIKLKQDKSANDKAKAETAAAARRAQYRKEGKLK